MSMEHWWNDAGKLKYLGKTSPTATLFTTYPPCIGLRLNPELYSYRLSANHLCHGMHKIESIPVIFTFMCHFHLVYGSCSFYVNLKLWPPLCKFLWIPTCFAWSATKASWISCTDLSGFRCSTLLWDSAVPPALSSFTSFDAGRGVRARWTT